MKHKNSHLEEPSAKRGKWTAEPEELFSPCCWLTTSSIHILWFPARNLVVSGSHYRRSCWLSWTVMSFWRALLKEGGVRLGDSCTMVFPKTSCKVLSHGDLWLSFCNWLPASRVRAFAGMHAVSTDTVIPNTVGDLALTQREKRMSVFLDLSTTALSKKYILFLP